MSSIRQTITEFLPPVPAENQSLVENAITLLEQREEGIVNSLLTYATGRGIDTHEAENILKGVGLIEPDPEPVTAEDGPSDGMAEVARRIEATLTRLEERTSVLERVATEARRRGLLSA